MSKRPFQPYRMHFKPDVKFNFNKVWHQLEKTGRALTDTNTSREIAKYIHFNTVYKDRFSIGRSHKGHSIIVLKPGFKLVRTKTNKLNVIRDFSWSI